MAGPELVRQWAGTSPVGRARSPYRRHDDTGVAEPQPRLIRFAWAGRTSTYDQQDPTLSCPVSSAPPSSCCPRTP